MTGRTKKRTPEDATRIEHIEKRLDALEARLNVPDTEARERRRKAIGVDVDLLERLAARDAEQEISGAVLYAGAVRIGSRQYAWHREHASRSLIEDIDPEALAPTLFALANPARLRIVLALAKGNRSGPELSDIADAGSAGQLYHHLGELLRAGVIGQPKRGTYELRTPALVPMLAIVAAALDLGSRDQAMAAKRPEP
jgi:DNA-binding transcriptional ArsR family regulator